MKQYNYNVALCFEGNIDYIFFVDKKTDIETAITYAFKQVELGNDTTSIELIFEYLNDNNINYSYIDISSIEKLTY